MKFSKKQVSMISSGGFACCRALQIGKRIHRSLSEDAMKRFSQSVRRQILEDAEIFSSVHEQSYEKHAWSLSSLKVDSNVESRDPVFWDQTIWENVDRPEPTLISSLIHLFEKAPTVENRISSLLAIAHIAHTDTKLAAEFFSSISVDHSDIEISEWATLMLKEMIWTATGDSSIMDEAVSGREFNYDPHKRFDIVLPLFFAGYAFTRIGPRTIRTVISPSWFYKVFGRANALVRLETIDTDLIIEKRMEGLTTDGKPHFETFPFSGDSRKESGTVLSHNYWAELARPFYSSGRTGLVGEGDHVVKGVPMTFMRAADTVRPEKYLVDGGTLIESTRGIFFGRGEINIELLTRNRFEIQAGNFQLTGSTNPITGKSANTSFYGTFYGKVSDWFGTGKIDFNGLPVHSMIDGRVDYDGDGTGNPTALRPNDWLV